MSGVNRGALDDGSFGTSTLHLSSASDPRWNCAWRGTSASPFNPAFEAKVVELTARYGPPPDDLEFGAIKD